jgi:hypothetical protein
MIVVVNAVTGNDAQAAIALSIAIVEAFQICLMAINRHGNSLLCFPTRVARALLAWDPSIDVKAARRFAELQRRAPIRASRARKLRHGGCPFRTNNSFGSDG